MGPVIFSVSQLTAYIKEVLSTDPLLRSVYIRGEVSNYKLHSSGHSYFTLKDQDSKIRCVMFRQYGRPAFAMQDGMDVLIRGYVSVYDRDGQYQLYVEEVEPFGIGALHVAFEQLKARLNSEGLFDETHKKPLPLLPKRIGIVTSDSGAAVRDIINIVKRRYPNMDLLIVPVAVQGDEAAVQISQAIDVLNAMDDPVDVIIVGRGGGSIEELWAFNEEIVARSIYRSRIPIISAVGHEIDFTIADFVADMRAPTPSAAAELAVPRKDELKDEVRQLYSRMYNALMAKFDYCNQLLCRLRDSGVMLHPDRLLADKQQYLDQLKRYLALNVQHRLELKTAAYMDLKHRLEAFNPLSALARGYTMTISLADEELIKSIDELSPGQRIKIMYRDGYAVAEIIDVDVEGREHDRG